MWVVHAKAPNPLVNKGWDWAYGYFPRKIHYKKDAMELAKEAIKKGGTEIRLEKTK